MATCLALCEMRKVELVAQPDLRRNYLPHDGVAASISLPIKPTLSEAKIALSSQTGVLKTEPEEAVINSGEVPPKTTYSSVIDQVTNLPMLFISELRGVVRVLRSKYLQKHGVKAANDKSARHVHTNDKFGVGNAFSIPDFSLLHLPQISVSIQSKSLTAFLVKLLPQ